MHTKVKITHRINFRIAIVLAAIFLAAGTGIILLNYFSLKDIYEQSLSERLLVCNNLASTLIDPTDVAAYVTKLSVQGDDFKKEQVKYNDDREKLYALMKTGGSDVQMQQLKDSMKVFHDKMEPFKDEKFKASLAQIIKQKSLMKAKYLYVFAYTGVVDSNGTPMMTFIFDAEDTGEIREPDADSLGTVTYYEDFTYEIYKTKKQMSEAFYYDKEPYGKLYFSFAPIIDKDENVVAIIGTDMGIEEMLVLLNRSALVNTLIFLSMIIVGIGFIYFFITRYFIKPVDTLIQTSSRLAGGEVDVSVPELLTGSRDEIGVLARSIDDMGSVFRDMITSTGQLFEATVSGNLEVRNDPSRFKGGISKVLEKMNDTLDATILYLNSVPENLFLVDKNLKLHFKNSIARANLGQIDHLKLMSQIFLDKKEASLEELKNGLLNALKVPDGSVKRWINGSCYSVLFREIDVDDSKENNVLIIAVDITDLENEKLKALSASNAKSEFLSRVSHELRTPMNVIIGMSSIGLKEETNPRTIERLKNIDASSRHLLTIINDVLDMSRIESGKMEIRNEPFRLKNMLSDCYTMFRAQADEKGLEFKFDADKDLPLTIDGDEQHIKQVVINLLSNSFKFTQKGGTVTLNAKAKALGGSEYQIEISVKDSGIGMSEEFLKRIFTPFEQEAVFLQRKVKGTGLGLSISKNLINLMGGDIMVESKENEGTKFTISLTLKKADDFETEATGEGTADIDISGMKVLIVDDIEINRLIFIEMLKDHRIKITEAPDGTDAVEMFSQSEPYSFDIIFMDIQMIKMDGYEATRQIRALNRPDNNVPIIAMTANALKQDVDNAIESGMNGHISKPIDYNVCIKEMSRFFRKKDK